MLRSSLQQKVNLRFLFGSTNQRNLHSLSTIPVFTYLICRDNAVFSLLEFFETRSTEYFQWYWLYNEKKEWLFFLENNYFNLVHFYIQSEQFKQTENLIYEKENGIKTIMINITLLTYLLTPGTPKGA